MGRQLDGGGAGAAQRPVPLPRAASLPRRGQGPVLRPFRPEHPPRGGGAGALRPRGHRDDRAGGRLRQREVIAARRGPAGPRGHRRRAGRLGWHGAHRDPAARGRHTGAGRGAGPAAGGRRPAGGGARPARRGPPVVPRRAGGAVAAGGRGGRDAIGRVRGRQPRAPAPGGPVAAGPAGSADQGRVPGRHRPPGGGARGGRGRGPRPGAAGGARAGAGGPHRRGRAAVAVQRLAADLGRGERPPAHGRRLPRRRRHRASCGEAGRAGLPRARAGAEGRGGAAVPAPGARGRRRAGARDRPAVGGGRDRTSGDGGVRRGADAHHRRQRGADQPPGAARALGSPGWLAGRAPRRPRGDGEAAQLRGRLGRQRARSGSADPGAAAGHVRLLGRPGPPQAPAHRRRAGVRRRVRGLLLRDRRSGGRRGRSRLRRWQVAVAGLALVSLALAITVFVLLTGP